MKVNTRTLLLLLLFRTVLSAQIGAPGYLEQHLQESLAKGLVFDIIQDQRDFMWFGTEYGLVRYDGYELRHFQYEPGNPYSLAGNVVTCLLEDDQGKIWVGTLSSGLHRFDPETERFTRFPNDSTSGPSDYRINDLAKDKQGNIWIATEGSGINRWHHERQQFDKLPSISSSSDSSTIRKVRSLHFDKAGRLWAGTQEGLLYWDLPTRQFKSWSTSIELLNVNALSSGPDGSLWIGTRQAELFLLKDQQLETYPLPASFSRETDHTIHKLLSTPDGQLWIGTDDGLIYFDEAHPEGIEYLFSNSGQTFSFFLGKDGIMWLGSNIGVHKIPLKRPKFLRKRITIYQDGDTLTPGVSAVAELNDQLLLIGTFQGVVLFEKSSGRILHDLSRVPGLSYFRRHGITGLWKDQKEGLWIASLTHFDGGFELFHLAPDGIRTDYTDLHIIFQREVIRDIGEDQAGNIWFGMSGGLVRLDPENNDLRIWKNEPGNSRSLPDNHIRRIFFDDQDQLWLGTEGGGLAAYHPETDDFTQFATAHSQVLDIIADQDHSLWIGTQGGLNRLNRHTFDMEIYGQLDGLPDNTVKSLALDGRGKLWIGTKNGFALLDPATVQFRTFNRKDGIQNEEYWEHIKLESKDGRLFFGGAGGFNYFHPDSLTWNTTPPPVVITEFRLFNQLLAPDPASNLLPRAMMFLDKLRLRHQHKVMTFRFTALNYHNSAKNQFAYQLEGFDPDWQYVGDRREVTYTNLDPGNYRFKVKASNDDGVWNEEGVSLEVVVRPPWFASLPAYLLYLTLLLSGFYFLYRFQLNRQLAQAETERLRELDAVKTQLYTNITHEFRTPLTLIRGPVDRALKDHSFSLRRPDLLSIRQNCQRLLHLIRQMLHLNKLEAGAVALSYHYGDIVPVVKYIVELFSSFAQTREVDLSLEAQEVPILLDHDREKLIDILSNLISNAIKFTPAGGQVTVTVSQKVVDKPEVTIRVQDTGKGIPASDLDKIFDRFYQVQRSPDESGEEAFTGGSGIGLALSQKLAELMEGRITVSSKPGRGSVFSLILPVIHRTETVHTSAGFPEIFVPRAANQQEPITELPPQVAAGSPTVLIVEDNADLANFIAAELRTQFQVQICADGTSGADWAIQHIPDLIVSDVLMPGMDGFELTRHLKTNQNTSHIPILLLTAKADLPSRVTGYERGADAYMTKPFDRDELIIRIENLLESRSRLQQYYLEESGLRKNGVDGEDSSPQEHEFLKKVRCLIEKHLDAGDYSIERLAGDLFMSSAQLYRKMIALTGLSPSKFYRNIQINRAKECLMSTELSVSEIAYRCGFNDPAYFSRVFTAELGRPPSAYRDLEQ